MVSREAHEKKAEEWGEKNQKDSAVQQKLSGTVPYSLSAGGSWAREHLFYWKMAANLALSDSRDVLSASMSAPIRTISSMDLRPSGAPTPCFTGV